MEKQLIISVGREFGSGGHAIAELLAKRFDLPLYDSNLLEDCLLYTSFITPAPAKRHCEIKFVQSPPKSSKL